MHDWRFEQVVGVCLSTNEMGSCPLLLYVAPFCTICLQSHPVYLAKELECSKRQAEGVKRAVLLQPSPVGARILTYFLRSRWLVLPAWQMSSRVEVRARSDRSSVVFSLLFSILRLRPSCTYPG